MFRVTQPTESLFNWLMEKTNIQRACKVRSTKGLLIHLFNKIAAAFINLIFKPLIRIITEFFIKQINLADKTVNNITNFKIYITL